MEKEQRTALCTAVVKMRRLLEKDFQEQLEGTYNILPDGRVLESAPGDPVVRARLLDVVQHHRAGGATPPEAVDRVAREAAFTVLNRFAALKMAERRHLVRECVSQGIQSEGIRELAECAPGLRGAMEDGGYRLLLDAVMDEISLDLKVLFNRRDSMALLWPGPRALDEMLETVNDPHLADVWAEDEAIGWIYQYFNDNDVKQMRDAAKGGAPRDSRELAVRNQFFTPRYVVEFLTDNTLGRLWYEMTGGETVLRERCRYLVRRPTEIFLKPGESAPASADGETGAGGTLSQEELLRQPVHTVHRPLKDPRDIRLLDPACGSMHFGLYAFDLFSVIYAEAWEVAHGPDDAAKSVETFAPFVTFAATFLDEAAFLREVPRLIVERNIHGIDIDPRAVQIAGLSLWLRAQRAWQQTGVKPADRPRITRSNLVCAEPMPGEKELLREFVEQEFPIGERPAFGFLLERVFDQMALAGEAGSLLRVEEDIRTAIADAKRLWKEAPKHEQASLFAESGEGAGEGQMRLDLSGITDEQFWERAEQRIYDALEAYAEHAENGGGFQRRLFADDAAQGFAFIDLCRKRYEVLVMNPPFGEETSRMREYVAAYFPRTKHDLFASFCERAVSLVEPNGFIGELSSRVGFFIKTFEQWRREIVGKLELDTIADLGFGVLDGATVEAAAYVIRCRRPVSMPETLVFRMLVEEEKDEELLKAIQGPRDERIFRFSTSTCDGLPLAPFIYWVSPETRNKLAGQKTLDPEAAVLRQGLGTGDNNRFLKLHWEVPNALIATGSEPSGADIRTALKNDKRWAYHVRSGASQPWYSPLTLVLDWANDGIKLKEFWRSKGKAPSKYIFSEELYFRPGFSWTLRAFRFIPYVVPSGCIPSASRYMAFPKPGQEFMALAISASNVATSYLRFYGEMFERPKHLVDSVKRLPFTTLPTNLQNALEGSIKGQVEQRRLFYRNYEPHVDFIVPKRVRRWVEREACEWNPSTLLGTSAEIGVAAAFGLSPTDLEELEYDLTQAIHVRRRAGQVTQTDEDEDSTGESSAVDMTEFGETAALYSYCVGCVFGRWDIRYASGARLAPKLPDPFASLPACPPGMLQGDDGLPLPPEAGRRLRAEGRYPLDVAWDGILVDDPEHPLDLERGVRAALAVLRGDRVDTQEHEAYNLLGVSTLREWFRRPAGFFADHLKRYSKSRRQAPIYWPLSTASGSYTIWVYYHRLTADTLFQLAEHVELKLGKTREERLRAAAGQVRVEGRESARLAKQANELVALEQELEEMRAELLRVAELPYRPNLNDGVQVTAAPLWKLFRFSKWRKELEATWKSLEKGDYDWAHLAYAIRPQQVREKCRTDRSLAIAHDLEDLCEVEIAPKKKPRKKSSE